MLPAIQVLKDIQALKKRIRQVLRNGTSSKVTLLLVATLNDRKTMTTSANGTKDACAHAGFL